MTSGNNIETEYLQLNSKNEWPALYQKIRSKSLKDSSTCLEALKPQNKALNRYRDVSPYDHSRIILQRGSTDYINANLIKVEKAGRQYILTQGPLGNTVSHFWLMIWEQKTKAVLMLNKLIEKKQEKCFQYWPTKIGSDHILQLTDVGLTVEYLEQQDHSYYLTRVLRLTDTESGKSRDILQFHYITWPDFGVPCSPTAFLEFLRKVRSAGVLEPSVGPAVVHCSAGIGRSGTFCLVDSCLVLIEKFGLNSVDIKDILLEMRKYRMGLIQTPEQLRFSYQAIIEGAKQILNNDLGQERSQVGQEYNLSQCYHNAQSFPNSRVRPYNVYRTLDLLYTKLKENHEEIITNNVSTILEDRELSDEDDEPPPLPPPRLDSLKRQNGTPLDRPLPNIPNSVSDNDLSYENNDILEKPHIPSGPLPVVPAGEEEESEEDELEAQSESSLSDKSEVSNTVNSLPPSELRHRKRVERKEHMEAQVRDMKRRQQLNEQWTQLKRSLYIPLIIGGSLILGGGLITYFYFKS